MNTPFDKNAAAADHAALITRPFSLIAAILVAAFLASFAWSAWCPAQVFAASENETTTIVFNESFIDLSNNPYVELDGVAYTAKANGTANGSGVSITVPVPSTPSSCAHFATYYTYKNAFQKSATLDAANANYPVSMYVWKLEYSASPTPSYTATYLPEFNDILKYAGCSVRTSNPHGIRLVTSIPTSAKTTLIHEGLRGYTLEESGTIVQWTDKLQNASLTYDATTLRGTAYSSAKGTDPVYKSDGTTEKYTNVLTGFTDEQCAPLLSLRPYLLLSDGENSFYLYGGTVSRSIGYIASQNTSVYTKGTAGYRFIWNTVHAAYGTKLDAQLGYVDWNICNHVTFIDQNPELPSGCEAVATVNALNGFGFGLQKTEIYDNYLSFSSWDFAHAYCGDGRSIVNGGNCFPPAITDAANRYLVTKGVRERAYNITGASFDTIMSYLDEGYPVIVWSTIYMYEPRNFSTIIDGYQQYNNLHCVTLYGHDGTNSVYVSDSLSGNVARDYSAFASLYDRCGHNAVVIL